MKLDINHKKKTGKETNMWRLNNMPLNNQWVNHGIKERKQNKTKHRQMKMKAQSSKIFGT